MDEAAEKKRLMRVRKRISQNRPKFRKFESWRFKRLKDNWRRPTGIDNKMRQKRSGWPKTVNVGYGSPKAVRHLHPSGREEVFVYNVGDLAIVDPETQVARIGGTVGARKRIDIVEEALKRDIRILNPGEARSLIELEEMESEGEGPKEEEPEGLDEEAEEK
jgi:large subunit ribosomal protein L32e